MEENKFWLSVWRLIAAVVCVFIVSITSCSIHANQKRAGLVEAGIPAVDVNCAISNGGDPDASCALSGAKLNQRED